MKDILLDIVTHTHSLGFLSLIKISENEDKTQTTIESMAEDRSVILQGYSHKIVPEFNGTFGMGNLEKLNLLVKNPEYREHAKIEVVTGTRNNEIVPTHIHFENQHGDFQNDYRFMNKTIVEEKVKSLKYKGSKWDIVFEPSASAISRMKLQSAVHTEEPLFNVRTENKDLIFSFGDQNTHAGQFVFEQSVNGILHGTQSWPVAQVQSILNLTGRVEMSITNGAMQISVDSGLVNYNYILPAHSK